MTESMNSTRIRESACRRLMCLPDVFTLNDLTLAGLTSGSARVAVNTWQNEGYIVPAGPRVGFYYNLVSNREGIQHGLGKVLRAKFGAVVIIGPSVLNVAGWITQVPQHLTVAVPWSRSYPEIDGARLYGRPPAWFGHVHVAVGRAERGVYGLQALPPHWALADALSHGDSLHHMGPDDFDVPPDIDPSLLTHAFDALGLPADSYMPYLDASGVQIPLTFDRADAGGQLSPGSRR